MEKSTGGPPEVVHDAPNILHNEPVLGAPLAVTVPDDDHCPDGGYGWVCVASVFIFNAFTWGVLAV